MADGDGVSCHPGDLAHFLLAAVRVTGLTIIAGPYIDEPHGQGIVIIAESHVSIAIHGPRAFADVFSCQPFMWANVLHLLRETFGGTWRCRYFLRSLPPAPPG